MIRANDQYFPAGAGLKGGLFPDRNGAARPHRRGRPLAVEVESIGALVNGRHFNNHCPILFRVREGCISAIREYMESRYAAQSKLVLLRTE